MEIGGLQKIVVGNGSELDKDGFVTEQEGNYRGRRHVEKKSARIKMNERIL